MRVPGIVIQPTKSLFSAYTLEYFSKAAFFSGSEPSKPDLSSSFTSSATCEKASALCFCSRNSRISMAPEKKNKAAQITIPVIISLRFDLMLISILPYNDRACFRLSLCGDRMQTAHFLY